MQAQIIVDRFLRSSLSIQYGLNVFERMLLVIIASYIGSDTECYPSHMSLATYTGMSTDSVRRYTKNLAAKKLIIISRSTGENNIYRLSIPVASSTPCSQQPPATNNINPMLPATTPPADSTTNNIINNIKEYTSLDYPKKQRLQKQSQKSKSAFSEEIEITDSHKTIAIQAGLNVEAEYTHFKEHHLAKGSEFVRWDMAFNTWLRNAAKFSRNKRNSSSDTMAGVE